MQLTHTIDTHAHTHSRRKGLESTLKTAVGFLKCLSGSEEAITYVIIQAKSVYASSGATDQLMLQFEDGIGQVIIDITFFVCV